MKSLRMVDIKDCAAGRGPAELDPGMDGSSALIRRCDVCRTVTAIDLDNTLKHKRRMQLLGQTVYEVTEEEARTHFRSAGPCRCEKSAKPHVMAAAAGRGPAEPDPGMDGSDGRCPTCRQRNSRVREHDMGDGSMLVWHCNVPGCSNHEDNVNNTLEIERRSVADER